MAAIYIHAPSEGGGIQVTMQSEQLCIDPLARHAAELAQRAYPDTLPPEERRKGRNKFITINRWVLFDTAGTGYLNFEQFLSSEWASFLAQVPIGRCRVTKDEFFRQFLGYKGLDASGWNNQWEVDMINNLYGRIDRENKGYIVKRDISAWVMETFSAADKKKTGEISREDLSGDRARFIK